MAIVMIRCPATGTPISTQHRASDVQFAAQTYVNAAVRCAICGDIHHWNKADAWLQPYRGAAAAGD